MSGLEGLSHVKPQDIERQSMRIIERELAALAADGATGVIATANLPVVKRVIHATADFEFACTLAFSTDAVARGVEALAGGCSVVTDTQMVAAGVNKRVLGRLGGQVYTFISDDDVADEARKRGITRSAVCMERAAQLDEPLVFAIGNAPTALVRLAELFEEGRLREPALVIGVPVGFVNVVESKELIRSLGIATIVTRGRKGGSTVAVAILNALLYQSAR